MSFSPSDAENPLKQIVDYVVHKKGRKEAFREAVEIVIARESNEFINNS